MNVDQGLTDAETSEIIRKTESRIHRLIAFRFLQCEFDDGATTRRLQKEQPWATVSSLPADEISTQNCLSEWEVAGKDCVVVNAYTTPGYVAISTVDDLLFNQLGPFLDSNLGLGKDADERIESITFRGYDSSVFMGEMPEEGDRGTVSGVQQQTVNNDNRGAKIGGGVAVGVAVVGLVVVLALLARRQRRENDPYLVQKDDDSFYSLGAPSTTLSLDEPREKTIILNDEDDTSTLYMPHVATTGWNHDSRTCKSKTCVICQDRKAQQPTFIPAEEDQKSIKKELGTNSSLGSRDYSEADTVDL
jgi:hypothetical protein